MFDVEKVEYVNSSQVFGFLQKFLDIENISEMFSECCSDITYGDANVTLIRKEKFFEILEDALFAMDLDAEKVGTGLFQAEAWFRGRTDYINLEA